MKDLLAALFVASIMSPAEAQVHYQYVPNNPEWPSFSNSQEHSPDKTVTCITVNSRQNGNQQYPLVSYQFCN
jgi:hypothetical protein